MAKVKNISPFGDLEVPALGIEVLAGEVVEVSDDAVAALLDQPLHWESADGASASKASATPTNEEK